MEDNFKLIEFNDDDVIDFGGNTYKINKFIKAVIKSTNYSLAHELYSQLENQSICINSSDCDNWFNEGIDCEILNLGSKSWKKGKVKFKLSVEFYVEENTEIKEPESPLDDLRRMITDATS
ncbi:KGK domain-containing protein [Anabaena cylindrica UHCC 0172]|uniref:KGK domain-containing protein n=1 Tax=Anabaena cylindrica TaxID=1165 RepID=UPI002B1FC7E6|nr:KGK domain-containing protein [Anabaena cylindrica]MEA5554300.1 KGK domain-containing protein [Anabaena cylindrica UHCC 0172]